VNVLQSSVSDWSEVIYNNFRRSRIRQVGYVPDAGLSKLIKFCQNDPEIADVVLTTEEEGVGLIAGAALGGQRAALLMQSSGVGNCVNMFSLVKQCRFPCLIVVTMRGEYAEFNPWQVSMGSMTEASLKMCGFLVYRINESEDVDDVVPAACDICFDSSQPVAVILSQRLIGRKRWNR